MTRLFIGSEGTLGVITEVQLRLYPLPEAISSAVCGFETVEARCLPWSRYYRAGSLLLVVNCWMTTR